MDTKSHSIIPDLPNDVALLILSNDNLQAITKCDGTEATSFLKIRNIALVSAAFCTQVKQFVNEYCGLSTFKTLNQRCLNEYHKLINPIDNDIITIINTEPKSIINYSPQSNKILHYLLDFFKKDEDSLMQKRRLIKNKIAGEVIDASKSNTQLINELRANSTHHSKLILNYSRRIDAILLIIKSTKILITLAIIATFFPLAACVSGRDIFSLIDFLIQLPAFITQPNGWRLLISWSISGSIVIAALLTGLNEIVMKKLNEIVFTIHKLQGYS